MQRSLYFWEKLAITSYYLYLLHVSFFLGKFMYEQPLSKIIYTLVHLFLQLTCIAQLSTLPDNLLGIRTH